VPIRFRLLRRTAFVGFFMAAMAGAYAQASAPAAAMPAASAPKVRGTADIIRDAPASAWRRPDPNDVLAMTLPSGIVWIELAQRFAPRHAANIRTLVAQHYFDGLAVIRVQDNYVAQWGDPAADDDDASKGRSLGAAAPKLQPEFSISDQGLTITRLKDRDVWAPVTGFVDGFPVAADPKTHRAWVAHCYGTIGAARGNPVDSASGAELYAVIGQSPRGLDLNITPVARVLQGMELLSSLPRGGQNMGFYDKPEQDVRITKIERLADMPEATRPDIQVFRTDTPQWAEMIESRRNRKDAWSVHKAGAIDLCNITVPVRIEPRMAAN
jgi:cyclophilin family peptidyl-prolyl cis-trans isomerase